MNYLDIIIGIPLLWAVYKGFTKGFIITLASLIALIAGIYGAIHFSDFAGGYLNNWFHPKPEYLFLVAFTFTFLLIIGIIYLIAYILDRIIKATGLGIFNRLAGVVFNFFKMALIVSVLMSIISYADIIKPLIPESNKEDSMLYGPVSKIAPAIFPYLNFEHLRQKQRENKPPEKRIITQSGIH